MSEVHELKTLVFGLLATSPEKLDSRLLALVPSKQKDDQALVPHMMFERGQRSEDSQASVPLFSGFIPEHLEEARRIYVECVKEKEQHLESVEKGGRKASQPDEVNALKLALGRHVQLRQEGVRRGEDPELYRHVLKLMLTHDQLFRRTLTGAIPPLSLRAPEMVRPSRELSKRLGAATNSSVEMAPAESALDWYREDPLYNEHHDHWHIVYPHSGIDDPPRLRDRQGELFVYMHRQMLARYDTERLALGLERVNPYYEFNSPVPAPYDPGEFVRRTGSYKYSARAPNSTITKTVIKNSMGEVIRQMSPDTHTAACGDLMESISQGFFRVQGKRLKITPDLLGATLEGTVGGADGGNYKGGRYGNYHNNGHVMLALVNYPILDEKDPKSKFPGVMLTTSTAIRDPIFWQWHKHIDDLAFQWQERLSIQDFSDAPPASLRQGLDENNRPWTPDLILCNKSDLPEGALEDLQKFGEQNFGGDHWDTDCSTKPNSPSDPGDVRRFVTDRLYTEMKKGTIEYEYKDDQEAPARKESIQYPFLNHEPFYYFIRIKNEFPMARTVTVRLFLVPEGQEEDRRMWIEMDKFLANLGPSQKAVIARADTQSAVIRKPAVLDPDEYNRSYTASTIDIPDAKALRKKVEATEKESDPAKILELLTETLQSYSRQVASFDEKPKLRELLKLAEKAKVEADEAQGKPEFQARLDAFLEALAALAEPLADELVQRTYCECGLPYNLLLPRGKRGGMEFKLLVMLTDWEKDRVSDETCCGSLSFCGALDVYPDKRIMGYPFDRRFQGKIMDTIASHDNMACRSIVIDWRKG